jgi:hypothetical protein
LLASSPEALAANRDMASSFISNPFPFVFSQPSLYLTCKTRTGEQKLLSIFLPKAEEESSLKQNLFLQLFAGQSLGFYYQNANSNY